MCAGDGGGFFPLISLAPRIIVFFLPFSDSPRVTGNCHRMPKLEFKTNTLDHSVIGKPLLRQMGKPQYEACASSVRIGPRSGVILDTSIFIFIPVRKQISKTAWSFGSPFYAKYINGSFASLVQIDQNSVELFYFYFSAITRLSLSHW